jgi:hypothetical protein
MMVVGTAQGRLCPPYTASAANTVISGHSIFQRLAFAA